MNAFLIMFATSEGALKLKRNRSSGSYCGRCSTPVYGLNSLVIIRLLPFEMIGGRRRVPLTALSAAKPPFYKQVSRVHDR